jgi:hypothetical protein
MTSREMASQVGGNERSKLSAGTSVRKQAPPARTRRVPDARIVGHEGEARTPFADSAVTTRSPHSSGG